MNVQRPKVRYTANGVAYVEPGDLFKSEAFWREIERTARAAGRLLWYYCPCGVSVRSDQPQHECLPPVRRATTEKGGSR